MPGERPTRIGVLENDLIVPARAEISAGQTAPPEEAKFVGANLIEANGRLLLLDEYWTGNLAFGKFQPREEGWSGLDERRIRTIRTSESLGIENAALISARAGTSASVNLLNRPRRESYDPRRSVDQFSTVSGEGVDFIYLPFGLQSHGTVGGMPFLTPDGRHFQFGGQLVEGARRGTVIMRGGNSVILDRENPSLDLAEIGVVVTGLLDEG